MSQVDRRVAWSRINAFGGSGIGEGPVYPALGASGGTLSARPDEQFGGAWASGKLFWYVRASYRGRVLIRGRRLDGSEPLGFNGRALPVDELRIDRGETAAWDGRPRGSRGIPSAVRVLSAGCYAVQIDGSTFSRIAIFTVKFATSE